MFCKKSACQNLLTRAGNGLNTTIGEVGLKFRGENNVYRLLELLRQPRLLLFDEAISIPTRLLRKK
jgi:ATP-binding cassette subfamily B protein